MHVTNLFFDEYFIDPCDHRSKPLCSLLSVRTRSLIQEKTLNCILYAVIVDIYDTCIYFLYDFFSLEREIRFFEDI